MKLSVNNLLLDRVLIAILIIVAGVITFLVNIYFREEHQHFIELAQSFLHGRVDLIYSALDRGDIAPFNGKAYWPLGPFPAVLLLPFVALFGNAMTVGFLSFPLIVITFLFLYKIILKKGFTKTDCLWLVFAFMFASPYMGVAWVARSWQFSHIVVVFFLSWALYEYYNKKRYWLIGIFFAFILATRFTAAFCVLFFILEIFYSNRKKPINFLKQLAQLGLPIILSLGALLIYNYSRFGSIMEFGYALANLGPDLVAMRSYGVMSIRHIPINLYYSFIALPKFSYVFPYVSVSMWGMGIFYSAPYYLSLIWKRMLDKTNIFLWISIIATLLPILMYFGMGPYQLSFRYSLDFLPLLFLIFIRTIYFKDKKLTYRYKIVIFIAFILNFYLFTF